MKFLRNTLFLLAALMLATAAHAANKQTKVYLFGVATSFNDSTVYFTDIQSVDSVWLANKTGFLMSRDNYSYQLRDWFAAKGESNKTCITEFNKNIKKLRKRYDKMMARYKNRKKFTYKVEKISSSDFHYQFILPYEIEAEREMQANLAKKKANGNAKGSPKGGKK